MNIFNNDLTPEENDSQFTLTEVDNESFAIEQLGGTYPEDIPEINPDFVLNSMNENRGKWQIEAGYDAPEPEDVALPDLSAESEEPQSDTLEEADYTELDKEGAEEIVEVAEEEEAVLPDLSAESEELQSDTLEEADYTELDKESAEEVVEVAEAEEVVPESEEFTEVRAAEPAAEAVEEISAPVPKVSSIEDVFNMEKDLETPAGGAAKLGADYVPSVEIDDELRSLMQGDLAADAPDIVEIPAEEPPPPPIIEEEKKADFMNVGSDEEEKVDKKETKAKEETDDKDADNSEELSWDSETDEIRMSQKTKKTEKSADKKKTNTLVPKDTDMTEEEEKNTTKKFALILVIVAVVMIFIIGGIIGYLYLSSKSNLAPAPPADTTAVHKTDTAATKPADTTSHKVDTTAAADTTATDSLKTDTAAAKLDKPKPVEPEPKVVPPPPAKPRVVQPPKPARQPASKPRTTTTARPKATTPPKSSSTAKPKTTTTTETLYSIQMYSSPSRADAEERLALLANRNITGYISTQQIKGQTWYRVRFGRYASYEEAAAEVSRLGLQDAWIERVK